MKYLKVLILFSLFISLSSYAQKSIKLDNYYSNSTDQLITIKSITVLPFTDNTKGIYAKPFAAFIKNWIEDNPKWDLKEIQTLGRVPSLNELETNPSQIKKYARNTSTDAFIAGKVIRSQNGVNLYLGLFLAKDGLLIAKEDIRNITELDFKGLNSPFKTIISKLTKQLPYDGLILSRKDKLVTLNLSKSDGILDGQDLTVASIIHLKRHPKFNFLISSEKVILGKLRVKKVDDSLTFAEIVVENEQGSIQKNAKIVGINISAFENKIITNYNANSTPGTNHNKGSVTSAQRWRPTPPPTFGKAEVTFGAGLLKAANGNRFSDNNFYPSVTFDGEVWVNDVWSVHAQTKQGIASLANPFGGPDLSVHTSSYELLGGYNFRTGGVYDTKVEILAGYGKHNTKVDGANPAIFTSTIYSGIKLGADVQTPIIANDILAGASIFLFLKPKLKEQPSPSGRSSDTSITMFKIYGMKKFRQNFYLLSSLNYDLYSTSFGRGITANSQSEKDLTLNFGINYFF